jgi:hypothetical protein
MKSEQCPICSTDISDCESQDYVFNLENYQVEGPYCKDCTERLIEREPGIYIESPDPLKMKMRKTLMQYGEKKTYDKIRKYTSGEIEKKAKLILKLKQPKETMKIAGEIMAFCHIAEADHCWAEKIWVGYNHIFQKKEWEIEVKNESLRNTDKGFG